MMEFSCRCLGRLVDDRCHELADEEDGLCRHCRSNGSYCELSDCCEGMTSDEADRAERMRLQATYDEMKGVEGYGGFFDSLDNRRGREIPSIEEEMQMSEPLDETLGI